MRSTRSVRADRVQGHDRLRRWLHRLGPERQLELALLRLTGLFDRPAFSAIFYEPFTRPTAIAGPNARALVKLKGPQSNIALKRLSEVEPP